MKSKRKFSTFSTVYLYLVLLRIVLVFLPQIGYIHPDEFFQSVEVLVGKFLDVEHNPPWEFNSSLPIRSMTVPYFTVGMCYKFLQCFSSLGREYLPNFTLLTPYSVLVAPRVMMCVFSFIVDYSLYKICWNNNEKFRTRLVILGSSYVMNVYATRTFSNTFELVFLSILLYFVSESMTFSNTLLRKKEYIQFRYEKSKSVVEKANFHKMRLLIVSDTYRNGFWISTTVVVGFFNRPTFLAFAVIPVFFWLYRGIGSKTVTVLTFHARILFLLLCAIPGILLSVLIDSFYYGYITWGEIGMLDVSINNFVFTPLNFLKYNLNKDNLAIHGLHPRFLHVLVNIPLLFNILGITALLTILHFTYLCYQKKFNLLPTIRSIKCLMTFTFVVPVALLSFFPHQEPRFLIPIIVPLVYLYAHTILPEPDVSLIEAPKIQPKLNVKEPQAKYGLLKIWLLVNTLLTIFYGFIHQGGVYQATAYLNQDLNLTPLNTEFHVITSHIYSLPESFLMQKPGNKVYSTGKMFYSVSRRVHLYEEGSKDLNYILSLLTRIVNTYETKLSKKYKIYLIIPRSLEDKLHHLMAKHYINLYLVESFYPHLSTEAFPDFSDCCEGVLDIYKGRFSHLSFKRDIWRLLTSFGLNLYQVSTNKL